MPVDGLILRREFGFVIVGAIVLAVSLMWKDVLVDVGEKYFPKSHGVVGKIVYTTLITVILLAIAVHLKTVFRLIDDDQNDTTELTYMKLANGNGNGNGKKKESFAMHNVSV
jgi:Family of unknown function (DUF5654)